MKRQGTNPELVSISVRVERPIFDRFKELADRDFRPVATEVRRLIQQRIDEAEA
jgi:predicted DNA-binding protein